MIIKPTDKEAKLLDRALSYVHKYVDEICITQAGQEPNHKVSEIIKKYKGKESFFKWTYNFSEARNFNFEQATGDYIFWIDADDVVRGAEKLPGLIKKMEDEKIDAAIMNYLYDFWKEFDFKVCTVKHLKTRVVKRGSVTWIGEVHEDFSPERQLNSQFTDEIEVLHITDEERVKDSSERNIEIAKKFMEKNPEDPRSEWLMANALCGEKREEEAITYFKDFVKKSNSDEEIFIAYMRLGDITRKDRYYLKAMSIRPDYPDAYLKIGELYANQNKLDRAKRFILIGLQIRVPSREIIVYNPRDYDFNPMLILASVYFGLKEYTNAILVLERCQKIIPDHPKVKEFLGLLKGAIDAEKQADKYIKKAEKLKGEKLRKFLDKIPQDLQSHPKVALFRNLHFTKETSTGKDIAYYCGYTDAVWYPGSKKQGGSEEAVVNLAKQWKEKGYNVTVYNNCGKAKTYDGVEYKPYWMYNPRDKWDILVFWRSPRSLDFEHNATKMFVDVHDVIGKGEFTKDRLDKVEKILFKTKAHRNLYPNVPDEKCEIIPNGVDPSQFELEVEKNQYLILNTSSPDRHLDATLDIFEELIKRQPDKPWKLAWYYGWDNFLAWHKDNKELMEFYKTQSARFDKLVKEGRAEGGVMIPQEEIAKKYLEAGIFLYPTQFFEIHCISAVKAQLAGCKMVVSDFAALKETALYARNIHTSGKKWGKENTFGDTENIDSYVKEIEDYTWLNDNGCFSDIDFPPLEMKQWTRETYNWDKISNNWIKLY